MFKTLKIAFSYLLIIALLACSDDDAPSPVPGPGYDFFPLEIGVFKDYSINEKEYFLKPDSLLGDLVLDSTQKTFFLRTRITDRFLDFEGDSAYRMSYFVKNKLEDDWPIQADSIARIKLKEEEIIFDLNNRTFVKLFFPISQGQSWNGNKFNNLGEENYIIDEIGLSYENDTLSINQIILVIQSDVNNLIEIEERSEEYAPGIGLTRKKSRNLQFRQENGEILIGEIANGRIFTQELIGYGKN